MYRIEPYVPAFRDGVIAVVRAVYDEYGWTWEAEGYHRDLYNVEEYYLRRGGMFWALLAGDVAQPPSAVDEAVVGCVGVVPHGEECELHRMYLLAAHRGRGLGRRLLETAMAFGRECGCRRMRAWSDVKLTAAHGLYLACGFVRQGDRICDDPDQSHEYGFAKEPL